MVCNLEELSRKEVISVDDGQRIGFVRDVEIDSETGKAVSIIAETADGRSNPFRKPCIIKICWFDIVVIGKETILVRNAAVVPPEMPKKKKLSEIFEN